VLYRNGDRTIDGCLYVHIDPAEPFVAAAFYHPEKAILSKLRRAMIQPAFSRCLATLAKCELRLETQDTLVRLPREYASHAGTVFVSRPIDPEQLREANLVKEIVAFTRDAMPLLKWGWSATSGS
jgi:uncharacterized protein (DUF2461 family)